MKKNKIIIIVVWLVIGLINIIGSLLNHTDISLINYSLCWFMLMTKLIIE